MLKTKQNRIPERPRFSSHDSKLALGGMRSREVIFSLALSSGTGFLVQKRVCTTILGCPVLIASSDTAEHAGSQLAMTYFLALNGHTFFLQYYPVL